MSADSDELAKLREEVKKLREAIEARPVIYPQPIYVPVPAQPYIWPYVTPFITYSYTQSTGSPPT